MKVFIAILVILLSCGSEAISCRYDEEAISELSNKYRDLVRMEREVEGDLVTVTIFAPRMLEGREFKYGGLLSSEDNAASQKYAFPLAAEVENEKVVITYQASSKMLGRSFIEFHYGSGCALIIKYKNRTNA